MAITALPTPPTRDDPTNFAARGDAFLAALPTFGTEANAQADTVNIQTALATASASVSGAASVTALGAANYKGLWSSLTGALSAPASVTHNNIAWLLLNNLANVTLSEPSVTADWTPLYVQANQIGDIKQSTSAQDSTWLSCDGSEYTTATYPLLGAKLTNTSYDLTNSFYNYTTNAAGSIAYDGTSTYVMVDENGTVSSSADGVTWVERFVARTENSVGTVTYVNGYFCVGYFGGILYSTNGSTWSFKYLAEITVREVRFGAGKFVALGNQTSQQVYHSTTIDGTYTVATAGSGIQNRLFFFGTRFYVLGNNNDGSTVNIYSSTDAITWTAASSTFANALLDMDYDGTANYVAVGNGGVTYYSANGTSWTLVTNSGQLKKVKFANSLWVITVDSSSVYTSTNSSTWTARTTGLSGHSGIAFGNGKWVVVTSSSNRIAYSTDAITWTIVTAYKFGAPSTTVWYSPIIYAGGKFLYSHGANRGVVHTATDGAGVWTTGKNQKWIGLLANNSNENFFADNGTTLVFPVDTGVVTTTNQTAYTYRPIASGTITGINKIDYAGTAWFASGQIGVLYRSTDLITWTSVATQSYKFTSVNYNGSLYLATQEYDEVSSKVRTSTDGITWTERTVGTGYTIVKSIWFNNNWFVYDSTNLCRSANGISWAIVLSVSALQTVKVVNNVMYLLSSGGVSYRSTDGFYFSRLQFKDTSEARRDVEYFNNRYVITSKGNSDSTLDRLRAIIWTSTDGLYFYPRLMPQETGDDAFLLKIIGTTLYALGNNWIYSSVDGENWERLPNTKVYANSRAFALINFGGKVVLHTTESSIPASTTKFRVPSLTLEMGAPSFIKASY